MPGNIAKDIDALQHMTTGELAERYEVLHGQPVRTRHRADLIGRSHSASKPTPSATSPSAPESALLNSPTPPRDLGGVSRWIALIYKGLRDAATRNRVSARREPCRG